MTATARWKRRLRQLEDLYATGEVVPSAQPRIEHRPGESRQYVIVIGRKSKSVAESC
jgi:hypothetical protein